MSGRLAAAGAVLGALLAMVGPNTARGVSTDPAWLYDPLQVTEIDLEATPDALAQLAAAPDEYVPARITLQNGSTTYGPYQVGLRLKGHSAFRTLDGKAAFKVKFGFSVSGQKFFGLKALTLNNMVQDPSMLAESTTSLLLQAIGVPSARVGYAYVRLNGADYGLYADVETVDSVMVQRWFSGLKHLYEANDPGDIGPGHSADFQVQEGPSTDLSDLEALGQADAGGSGDWFDRMQPVADLQEIVRAMAAEHYVGQWDGYSVGALPAQPHNYYLFSDLKGRFSMIPSGTDQTWTYMERSAFGSYGNGVLMRQCVQDGACRRLYVDTLAQIAGSPALASLATQARAIRAMIAPWRALDPRREQSVADGEAQADAKTAVMASRPAELAAWLESPTFVDAIPPPRAGGSGPSDVSVTGAVTSASAPVGGSLEWRLRVKNSGGVTVGGVVLDLQLSPNLAYGFGQASRGSGCVAAGSSAHCELDWLGPSDDDSSADVIIGTPVTGPGEVSLTAVASYTGDDPTPEDNFLMLKANLGAAAPSASQPLTPPPVAARPVLGKPVGTPPRPLAGRMFTFALPVTRSDTGKPLSTGTLDCDPRVGGKVIRHAESFKAGTVRMSFLVPKTASGKLLRVAVEIRSLGTRAAHTYSYTVR